VGCDQAGGRGVQMSGRDLMTLEKRDDRWWLVADHFSPSPG
jgi:ketosteroid isomerase-like protein